MCATVCVLVIVYEFGCVLSCMCVSVCARVLVSVCIIRGDYTKTRHSRLRPKKKEANAFEICAE